MKKKKEKKLYNYFSFEPNNLSKAPSSPPFFNGLMWMFFQMRYFTACRESIEADAYNFDISMSTALSPSIYPSHCDIEASPDCTYTNKTFLL